MPETPQDLQQPREIREGQAAHVAITTVTVPVQVCVFQLVDTQLARSSHCVAPCEKLPRERHTKGRAKPMTPLCKEVSLPAVFWPHI